MIHLDDHPVSDSEESAVVVPSTVVAVRTLSKDFDLDSIIEAAFTTGDNSDPFANPFGEEDVSKGWLLFASSLSGALRA
jgi:hypothetical protein